MRALALTLLASAAPALALETEFNGLDWNQDSHRDRFYVGAVLGAGLRLGFQGVQAHDLDRLAVVGFCGFWAGALYECVTNDSDNPNAVVDLANATMVGLGSLGGGLVVYGGILALGPTKDGATVIWEATW